MNKQASSTPPTAAIKKRLEQLRVVIREERISWGELMELEGLVNRIPLDDPELLEAAGMPEAEWNRRCRLAARKSKGAL